ncbi:hypothetical protein Tco_1084138 [Tanacetum coccineum]
MTKSYSSTSFIGDCFISKFIQRWRWRHLIPAESDSLPHAHAQSTKSYYKHQDPRIKKAQELKTKTSANSDIKDNSSETKLRGRLLESFQKDAKYEHVGQDTRSSYGVKRDMAYQRQLFTSKRARPTPITAYPTSTIRRIQLDTPYPIGQTIKDPALNVIEERYY